MTSRAKRQRHKYSPIHMVTALTATSSGIADSPTAVNDHSNKENQPPNLLFSHSQLYDDDRTTQPSQPSQQQPHPSPERLQLFSRPLPLPSPPRKHNSAFVPLTPVTPLSFRDVQERTVKPLQLFSTPQSQAQQYSQQQRPSPSSAYFRPITQPLPSTPLSVSSISFTASVPSTPIPIRPTQFSSPFRPSHPTPPPPPQSSSYSSEKARFLRSLPYSHRYGAIVATLEEEEQAAEQAATEWSESLTAPTTPPLSPRPRRSSRTALGNETDVPATPPSVCSLSSSSASSVGSFTSPISAALSAIMERDSGKSRRGVLDDDEILTPSPDVLPGSASTAGGVPSLPASIFSSVFSQRLPLPPLTAEAKQMMVESPLRAPPAAAKTRVSSSAPVTRTPPLPALQPTAFTFAAPHLTASTSAAGEWKGVIHIDEDRLYNATPTQSSASCSPVSASCYISASPFLSQASAASAASTASTSVPSSSSDCDFSAPQLETVLTRDVEDEEEQQMQQPEASSTLLMQSAHNTEQTEVQPVAESQVNVEMQDAPAERPKRGKRALRTPLKIDEANGAEQSVLMESAGKRRRLSRLQQCIDMSIPPPSSDQAIDDTPGSVRVDETVRVNEKQPKRRSSARVASAVLSQAEEETEHAARPATAAVDSTRKRRGRASKSLTPPSIASAIATPASPALSSTQPDLSLSQRSHRSSRSALLATWQCGWCTWESPLPHMSCDMCSKARGSRPDAVVEVEMRVGGKRGRKSSRAVTAASQSNALPQAAEDESQGSEGSASEASGAQQSTRQPSETGTPVSQQLLQTPVSSSSASASQPSDTVAATLSQPTASPSPDHSPALSPDTLLADANAEAEAEAATHHRWMATQPTDSAQPAALFAARLSSRGRRRERFGSSGFGGISATQAADNDAEQLQQLDTTAILHRRRRRRHW